MYKIIPKGSITLKMYSLKFVVNLLIKFILFNIITLLIKKYIISNSVLSRNPENIIDLVVNTYSKYQLDFVIYVSYSDS